MLDAESAAGGAGPGFIAGAFTMADVEQVEAPTNCISIDRWCSDKI
jgi:hypothetical protein